MKLNIDIRFSVDIEGLDIDAETLRARINSALGNYNDGRYPYSVEQMHDGMTHIVRHAVERAVEAPFRDRHGNKVVNGQVAAVYLADKAMSRAGVYTSDQMRATAIQVAPCQLYGEHPFSDGSPCPCNRLESVSTVLTNG